MHEDGGTHRWYRWRWTRLLAAVGLCAGAFFAFWPFDVAIGRWRAGFMPFEQDGFADQVFEGFKNFAQPLTIVSAAILVGLLDKRRKRIIIALLLAQLGANLTYNALKLTLARERPRLALEKHGDAAFSAEDTWRGYRPGNTGEDYKSFPSGHSAAAFALAGVLAWYYPRAAGLFWALACGCAFSRVLHGAHWPSDCAVGAGIGYIWAQISLRIMR
jgi:membrane-associated phospholipid phosphatase